MTRTTFTTITPLPAGITRQAALDFLHNHAEMIDLNPLVIERHPISPPTHASADEHSCTWYSITDKISYLPGTNLIQGNVNYTCAFHDIPAGLQTHCYAAMGLDIRDRWSVGGSGPGETPEPQELGLGAPMSGLYIREDVDFKCNMFMAGFVKRTMKKAHGTLVEAMTRKAQSALVGFTEDGQQQQQQQDQLRPGTGLAATHSRTSSAGERRSSEDRPFVSSGANQGQPGQTPDVRPYQPPKLLDPSGQGGLRPQTQQEGRDSYSRRSGENAPRQQPQQQHFVAEMEGDSSYSSSRSRSHSQNRPFDRTQ